MFDGLPNSIVIEQQVLSALILGDKLAVSRAMAELVESDFLRMAHQLIFRACQAAYAESRICNGLLAITQLQKMKAPEIFSELPDRPDALSWCGGKSYLAALAADRVNQKAFEAAIKELRGLADMRRLLAATSDLRDILQRPAPNPAVCLPEALAVVRRATAPRGGVQEQRDVSQVALEWIPWRDAIMDDSDDVRGARLGVYTVDYALGGLSDHLLVMLKGLSKFGKSSLALHSAVVSAEAFGRGNGGEHVLVYPMEDLDMQYMRRLVGRVGNISNQHMRRGAFRKLDVEGLRDDVNMATADASVLPMIIDSSTRDIDEICKRALVTGMQRKLGLVIVDYVQLLRGGVGREGQELIGYQVSQLETLAKELGCPVLAASQVTTREDGSLAAKNSNQYDEKATLAMAIWRGPLGSSKMSMDERRRSDEVHIVCTHNRRGAAFAPVKCVVDYATDRWRSE
jgi:replicative DNA helicase